MIAIFADKKKAVNGTASGVESGARRHRGWPHEALHKCAPAVRLRGQMLATREATGELSVVLSS